MRRLLRTLGAAGPLSALVAVAACGSTSDSSPGGSSGTSGASGTSGSAGATGSSGASGSSGSSGASGDGGSSGASGDARADVSIDGPTPQGDGRVTLLLPDKRWHRVAAKAGGAVEDITSKMDSLSAGKDNFVGSSKAGDFVVASSARFGCASGSCLDLFNGTLAAGDLVKDAGQAINLADARAAVASGGGLIVFAGKTGPHSVDLYAVKKSGGVWGAPVLLTADSPFAFHHDVSVASDGSRAVFDCGADLYGQPPTSMCEVLTDGTGFHEVLGPADGPDHGATHALHHPDYTPQGDFVFEADWPSEQIWKVARGSKNPVKLSSATETDDNSPCVLPDGRIASLWLGRAGNPQGAHELKVMNADGSGSVMVLTGQDIIDIGMTCGN